MNAIVLDASITAAWCFEDEQPEAARALLRRSENTVLFVPAIWPLEMANVLLVSERRGRITPSDSARFIRLLDELSIEVDHQPAMQPFDAVLLIGRTYGLSAYDASYIELALRLGAPIATLDRSMQTVAKRAGVGLA